MSTVPFASLFAEWHSYLPSLLSGLTVSLRITGISLAIGLPLALLLALAALAERRPLRALAGIVIEAGRGVPSLVVLEFIYFGLPHVHVVVSALLCAVATFTIATAAYTSEMFRAGLQALPKGQYEAASALGLTQLATNRYIIVPQAVRIVIGPVLGYAILIFQGTSLAIAIAVPELLSRAYAIGSDTFHYMSVLVLAGLMYAVIALPAAALVRRLERRLAEQL